MDVFTQLSLVILLAAGVAIVMRLLKQPLIVGHILTGLIAGPYLLNIIRNTETLDVMSKLGVATLLFIVGLNLTPQISREVGKASIVVGLGQIAATFGLGYWMLSILGFNGVTSAYLAIALAFSSTIIVLKLLSDKGDIEKLYGKVSAGILLVQDVVAAAILILIPVLAQAKAGEAIQVAAATLAVGAGATVLFYFLSRVLLGRLSQFAARSPELLFLFAIAWGLGLAAIFGNLGFSLEIGALIAGISLSATPYAQEMASRIKPIRDLFIVLFFILLGSRLQVNSGTNLLVPVIALSLFVIVVKPLLVFILMNLLGYTRRSSFQTATSLAQISEFSLILATLGSQFKHLDASTVTLITLVGLLTIAVSTYMTWYEGKLYSILDRGLKMLEFRRSHPQKAKLPEIYDTILFGFHRVGQDFIESFKDLKRSFIVVDFDPESIELLKNSGIRYRYGDASDAEFLDELNFKQVGLVVSTIPDIDTNLLIAEEAKKANSACVVIAVSHNAHEAQELYRAGATYVVMPHYLGAQAAAKMIVEHDAHPEKYEEIRKKHLKYLESRKI